MTPLVCIIGFVGAVSSLAINTTPSSKCLQGFVPDLVEKKKLDAVPCEGICEFDVLKTGTYYYCLCTGAHSFGCVPPDQIPRRLHADEFRASISAQMHVPFMLLVWTILVFCDIV